VLKTPSFHSRAFANVTSIGRPGFEDEADDLPFKRLTRGEAAALAERDPPLSPWRVVAAQAALGALIALIAWAATGSRAIGVSALYGAFVVVLPGALMARGMTSPFSRLSPVASALAVMFWAGVKIAASVLMLVIASKVVQPLNWPALLMALVACLQVYWLALLWRSRSKN
jgi:ATP synthase protein I